MGRCDHELVDMSRVWRWPPWLFRIFLLINSFGDPEACAVSVWHSLVLELMVPRTPELSLGQACWGSGKRTEALLPLDKLRF